MPHTRLRPTYIFDQDRLDQLRAVVPEAFADGKIDWETLRDLLGDAVEDPAVEHFGLSWPGKREARRLASRASRGALLPVPGEGVNEESTRNIFIEGENLEVLKLLLKSYAGRVKMIYIDPPYNTGNDFIYSDDFSEPLEAYFHRTGQADDEGLLVSNPRSSGRFHSNWLNMMYPRLVLARSVLDANGFIFVSISDQEVYHLRCMMNEIFGEENFVAQFIWNTEGHTDNQFDVKVNHEYTVVYARNWAESSLGHVVDPNTRAESNLWRGYAENSITKNGPANPPSEIVLLPGFPCTVENLHLLKTDVADAYFDEIEERGYITRSITQRYGVSYPIRLDHVEISEGVLTNTVRVYSGWANANKLRTFIENGYKPLIEDNGDIVTFFLSERGVIYYRRERERTRNILSVLRNFGTTERMRSELEGIGILFQYPKPKELIRYLMKVASDSPGIILDFFAGSCTTAHAIFEQNLEDLQERRFILVQLPERISPSSAMHSEYMSTISEIGKERIRRVISRLVSEGPSVQQYLDLGFRVYRLDRSHFKLWTDYSGDDVAALQAQFDAFEDALVDGWQPDNLLVEIMLIEGFPLDSTVTRQTQFSANDVRLVESDFHEHKLWVCLDQRIEAATLQALALAANDIFICLDNALDDQTKLRLADRGNLKTI